MVHNVAGLLLSWNQMHEFGNFLAGRTLTNSIEAFPLCCEEVEKFQHRFISLDLDNSKGGKTCKLMLVLWHHEAGTEFDVKKANRSRLTRTAREWLKARGVSNTEKLKFIETENTFCR